MHPIYCGNAVYVFLFLAVFVIWQILFLMEPDSWSAASIYQATRIFCSNSSNKISQRWDW